MKRIITSLLIVAASALSLNAQVFINENFTSPFNPATTGWVRVNNSLSPAGNWSQGNGTVFPAYNGAANDYYAVTYQSTSSTATNATISNWLITPTVTLKNGGILTFATRTDTNPATYPDRLEVYMSNGSGTDVGVTPTSVGTFSTQLTSINPALNFTAYPGAWTVYTVTLSGITTPTVGRIGFRYHVTNGGLNGSNSSYIGLDAVRYYNPCGVTVSSYTICQGGSATLTAMSGATPISYLWSAGASTNNSVVVNPGSTTTYTLNYVENNVPCPAVTSTVTIGGQLSINLSASASSVCAGSVVTLTANSTASTYTWSNGSPSTGPVATFTVNSSNTYSVGGINGFCIGGNTIHIHAFANPTISITATTLTCLNSASAAINFTGTGGSSYLWVVGTQAVSGSTVTLNVAAPTGTTPATRTQTIALIGIDANGCQSTDTHTVTISLSPTVTVTGPTSPICINNTATLGVTGAPTISWSNSQVTPVISYSNATAGTYSLSATGTNTDGCTASAAISVTVTSCAGIQKLDETSNGVFFPNPFTNNLKVSGFNGVISVYNAAGQVVIRTEVAGSAVINTSELAAGIYIVQGTNSNGEITKTEKLIKN